MSELKPAAIGRRAFLVSTMVGAGAAVGRDAVVPDLSALTAHAAAYVSMIASAALTTAQGTGNAAVTARLAVSAPSDGGSMDWLSVLFLAGMTLRSKVARIGPTTPGSSSFRYCTKRRRRT
jgi:hypothetical protein